MCVCVWCEVSDTRFPKVSEVPQRQQFFLSVIEPLLFFTSADVPVSVDQLITEVTCFIIHYSVAKGLISLSNLM